MKMRSNPGAEVFAQTASSPDEATADPRGVARSQFLSARNRRKFLKGGMFAVGATAFGAGLAPNRLLASQDDDRAPITKGDIAILCETLCPPPRPEPSIRCPPLPLVPFRHRAT